ncbi:MAG TPA: 3-deoxy-8-phosphooctulonate synthase, partial [Methyloceanibacter sp.]
MNEVLKPVPGAVVTVGNARFGNGLPLAVIAGPC